MMATLVLTAVGTLVGGPVGGAIGAVLGQQVDGRLFAPKARHGPRLGDLAVQGSSYGSPIPKLFGTMRVAGSVIWATDLREEKTRSGGGKGRPSQVAYSYSANFAVALSARPILAVRRIWADGKLLRGAAGDFKSATAWRLHRGGEDQSPDPLIVSVEGAGEAPAYRGLAYAVFEDFELADYGNRIPSLTFEVEADPGPVAIGALAAELSGGAIAAGPAPALRGYAAGGDSVRSAIEALGDLVPLSRIETGGGQTLTAGGAPSALVDDAETGAAADGAGGRGEWHRASGDSLPGEATLTYYDPARDYQTGVQRAMRPGAGLRSDRRAVAAVLAADEARALCEHRLDCLFAARRTARLHLGWSRAAELRPGAILRIAGRQGLWKIARRSLHRMVLTLELTGVPLRAAAAGAAAPPGRGLAQPDLELGPTTLFLFDLPSLADDLPSRPRLLAAAAGGPGWRRAQLTASHDGGGSWTAAGATAAPAVLGMAVGTLGAAASTLVDRRASVEVELLNEAMWLESRSEQALARGDNLAVLGDELIQFGVAEPLGGRRFRLSRLLRGRRGTEWAAKMHLPGEPFALLEADTLAAIEVAGAGVGAEARVIATSPGDEAPAVAALLVSGEALRPPAPVHLRGRRLPDGGLALSWVRRSRAGWLWASGHDTPLGEETEAYRLELRDSLGRGRTVSLAAPAFLYEAAAQAADGAQGAIAAEVVQLGTSGTSRPARLQGL